MTRYPRLPKRALAILGGLKTISILEVTMRCDLCHRDRAPGDACLEPGCPLRRDRQADPLNPANPASPLSPANPLWPGHSSRDDTDAHRHDPEAAP